MFLVRNQTGYLILNSAKLTRKNCDLFSSVQKWLLGCFCFFIYVLDNTHLQRYQDKTN